MRTAIGTVCGDVRRRRKGLPSPSPCRSRRGRAEVAGSQGAATLGDVDEFKARRVVDTLRERGTDAHLARVGVYQFGVDVRLPDGRVATWDSDGTAALEAQVMRNGVLVGFVPSIPGSEDFDESQVVDAMARTDYDKPIATQRRTAPPPSAPLPIEGGVFRRFLGGFRHRD